MGNSDGQHSVYFASVNSLGVRLCLKTMAPIRRYLRITKYSVLEVRIYLDQPSLAQTWLLNPRFNVLGRIIQAVRPLVLPKLREENERTSKGKTGNKSKKAKGVKDVVYDGMSSNSQVRPRMCTQLTACLSVCR